MNMASFCQLLRSFIAVLLVLPGLVTADLPPHPCFAYPIKVSKLRACPSSSASSFCSSYLGGPGSFTRTSTKYVTTTPTVTASTTPTPTSYSTITTTSTTYLDITTSILTYCQAIETIGPAKDRRDIDVPATTASTRGPAPSCGIAPDADPSEVSGACNCILAKNTVVKSTSTASTVMTTITEAAASPTTVLTTTTSTLTYSDQTTTFTVSTAAQCIASPEAMFYLWNQNTNRYVELQGDGSDKLFANTNSMPTDDDLVYIDSSSGQLVFPSSENQGVQSLYAAIDQYGLIEFVSPYIISSDPRDYNGLAQCQDGNGAFSCEAEPDGPKGDIGSSNGAATWHAYADGPMVAAFPAGNLFAAA